MSKLIPKLSWTMPAVFLMAVIGGCAVGPNYRRPPTNSPPGFRNATESGTNSLADLPWPQMFQDETLQGLIRIALTNSYDLRVAVARLAQSQAALTQSRAAFFPQLGYNGAATRGRNAIGGTPFFTGGRTTNSFVASGSVSWEIDFWGRVRRLNETARAQLFASQEARRAVMITLISEVAQEYFQLLALDRQLEIAERTTNSFGGSLRIFSARLAGGVASKLETSRAEAALASAAATVPDLERRIALQEDQLNVLIGRNPGPIPRNHTLLQQQLPLEVPAGLPSALLQRRPDIREAEQLLRAANAQVGVAVADFFPQISLTGLLGQVNPEFAAFTSGGALVWSAGANLTGPIFQGGRLVGQYRQALAVREQNVLQFQSTVLTAFQEVSDALISHQKLEEVRVQQARSVVAYEVAVEVSRLRYEAGRAGYFELLEAQQQLFPAENSLVQTQLDQLLTLVQLYRALGGGWEPGK